MSQLRPDYWGTEATVSEATAVAPAVPPGFLKLPEGLHQQWLDRKLGYFGRRQFVLFYFESRGEEVFWNDGLSCGFGTGGWVAFGDEVAPVAERCGMNLGAEGRPADCALLIDRIARQAYFVERGTAEAFVSLQLCARCA